MLIPAASLYLSGNRATGWGRPQPGYIPAALFLMPSVMHAVMLPTAATLHRLNWKTPPPEPGHVVINAIVGLTIVSVLTLFEEIGWRGWMLPRLLEHHSARRAVVISALIWAIWHIPFALAGIQYLEGVPPTLAAAVIPFSIFGAGLIIGWLWLKTQSLWIVTLAHGSLNNWGQYAFKFTHSEGQPIDALILAIGGLALIVTGTLLLCFFLPRANMQN